MNDLFTKNREREAPSFANINLLGKCNIRCYFCLGRDIEAELAGQNQLWTPYLQWPRFEEFLDRCQEHGIRKLYITGQNTDSLLYGYLSELIEHLHERGFGVGLRTNGHLAMKRMHVINQCDLSAGYSIHTLKPHVSMTMMDTRVIPDWEEIITKTERPRVQIVVTRFNHAEVFDIIDFCSRFKHLRYVQMRRVSTDRRQEELADDASVYDCLYAYVKQRYPVEETLWGNADVFRISGVPVCFWRTVKTNIGSFNYFTDGTISDEYFVVEGYLKARALTLIS
jgi:molybdenum cofactor biosynthesis enzyme MoaA